MGILKFLWRHFLRYITNEVGKNEWLTWPLDPETIFGTGEEIKPYGALNPEQIGVTKKVGPYLEGMIGQAAPQYTGQYGAPMSPEEQQMVSRYNALYKQAGEGISPFLQTYDEKGGLSKPYEEFFQNAIQKPMLKTFREDIQPGLEEQYAGHGGYWGSARAGAVGKGYRDLFDELSAQRSTLAMEGPLRAYSALTGLSAGDAAIQRIPRDIQQLELAGRYGEFVRTRPESMDYVNQALQFMGIDSGTYKNDKGYLGDLISAIGGFAGNYIGSSSGRSAAATNA